MISLISSPLMAILIVMLGLIGLFAGYLIAIWQSDKVGKRINEFVESPELTSEIGNIRKKSTLERIRNRFNLLFAGIKSEELHKNLIAANWPISVSEYVLIRILLIIVTFLIGFILGQSLISGVGLAILGYMIPGFLLFRTVQKRQKLFQSQLIDALSLIKGAVEVGNSFQQSVNVVIQEMDPPISDEFRQVRRETELGIRLNKALINMAERMESDDFHLVVTAVNINLVTGGKLSSILGVVTETIRQRMYLYSEIRALTSYANYASYLLTLLPPITMGILSIISPLYWERLLSPGLTRYVLIYALISVFVGNIVLRRIAKIDV